MRLHTPESRPPGYYIRSSSDEPERGPLTLDNLRDLAEFRHLNEQSFVRLEGEEKSRPLHEVPELLAAIFPQAKKLRFTSYQKKEDPDADRAPVDVRNIYKCNVDRVSLPNSPPPRPPLAARHLNPQEATDQFPTPPPIPEQTNPLPESPPESPGFDAKKLLEESAALSRARRAAQGSEPDLTSRHFSIRDSLLMMRWGLALLLVCLSFWLWSTVWDGANIFLSLLLGMIPMIGAILLTVSDIMNLALDGAERLVVRNPPLPADYGEAETRFVAGDWTAATLAYFKIIEQDPHQLRAYREGIASAVAAHDNISLAVFQASARKHLCAHDRNLLEGALRRHGLPPLPREPESSGTPVP